MALILDSGTVHLPPPGLGSRTASPPSAAKIVVSAPPTGSHGHGGAATP